MRRIDRSTIVRRTAFQILGVSAVLTLLAGCGTTIATTTDMFQTGRPLSAGQTRVGLRSPVYPPVPLTAHVERGLGDGFALDVGYGVHGIAPTGNNSSAALHGPEVYLTKQLLDLADILYLSGTGGIEVDVAPRLDAMVHAGVDLGLYPTKWLVLFGNVRGLYILGGKPGLMVSGGLGIDSPFTLKVAAYVTPIAVTRLPAHSGSSNPELLWPYGLAVDIGVRF